MDSRSIQVSDLHLLVHTQVRLVLQKWLLAFFYCGLMHTIACSRCPSAPVTCWAKWQQQTGRDSATKHCNAVLFLCRKENVALTYHFAILSVLKVKKIAWSLTIHALPCCCLWATGRSYCCVILFRIKLGLFLSHQNRLVLATYTSEDLH